MVYNYVTLTKLLIAALLSGLAMYKYLSKLAAVSNSDNALMYDGPECKLHNECPTKYHSISKNV